MSENLKNYKAYAPQKIAINGRFANLQPFSFQKHSKQLWELVGTESDIWKYLLSGPFNSEEDFLEYCKTLENHTSRTYYTCLTKDGNILGFLSLADFSPEHGRIEIAAITFSKKLQKTKLSTEIIFSLLKYCFENLNIRRVEWRCNSLNEPSKKAAERLGFTFEGKLRCHMISKGMERDTLIFSMLQKEWISIKKGFEDWLSDSNFDNNGIQKQKFCDFKYFKRSSLNVDDRYFISSGKFLMFPCCVKPVAFVKI